ncbi:hypothetical protein JXB28_03140 [Candidatus Woesearchaeota archaeon]|nr:hypothetical protein [Candidatus Woesearchaeota archaeon]
MIPQILALAFCGFASFSLLRKSFSEFYEKRRSEDLPYSRVRSVAMGRVKVQGQAKPYQDELIKAPISGKDCVFCEYIIVITNIFDMLLEVFSKGRAKGRRTYCRISKGRNFMIEDEGASVLVNPGGAEKHIRQSGAFFAFPFRRIPGRLKDLMISSGLDYKRWLDAFSDITFREFAIFPGDKLYILGVASDNPHVAEGTAKHGFEDVCIMRDRFAPFIISHKPRKAFTSTSKLTIFATFFPGMAFLIMLILLIIFFISNPADFLAFP